MNIVKIFIVILNLPRLILHIPFYWLNYNKSKKDVERGVKNHNIPINLSWMNNWFIFCYLIVFDRYFRNIFYHRVGIWKYILNILVPEAQTFIIGTHTIIGSGFSCVHPFSSVINARFIGENFQIKNNVTIGNNHGGIPTIGNNVSINVNSIVIGDILIGNNVLIGTCTLVMHNVPDNSVVVGNPAYIIRKDGKHCRIKLSDYNKAILS